MAVAEDVSVDDKDVSVDDEDVSVDDEVVDVGAGEKSSIFARQSQKDL